MYVSAELTGSYIEQLGIAKNVTILAGATWTSPTTYKPIHGKFGASLYIGNTTAYKGKLQLYFYDSTPGSNVSNSTLLNDFSTTARYAASGSADVQGNRVKVLINNNDTVDWTFTNLDIFHKI